MAEKDAGRGSVGSGFKGSLAFETYKKSHEASDVDVDTNSEHHTLGEGATQAARGSETKKHFDTQQGLIDTQQGLIDTLITNQNILTRTLSISSIGLSSLYNSVGFNVTLCKLYRYGNMVILEGMVERTGGSIGGTTSGNLSNLRVARLGSDWLPLDTVTLSTTSSGNMFSGYINSSGDVVYSATVPNEGFSTGSSWSFGSTYISRSDL